MRYADPVAQAEIDGYRAGSDPTPPAEGARHTAEQLWHHLLEASTHRRLYVLNQFLESQDDALRCMMEHGGDRVGVTEDERQTVEALDGMQTGDPEGSHGDADDLLLDLVHPDVKAAYLRLVNRCRWWACA